MDFSDALRWIKAGHMVARSGWNGKGMFLFLVPGSKFEVNRPPTVTVRTDHFLSLCVILCAVGLPELLRDAAAQDGFELFAPACFLRGLAGTGQFAATETASRLPRFEKFRDGFGGWSVWIASQPKLGSGLVGSFRVEYLPSDSNRVDSEPSPCFAPVDRWALIQVAGSVVAVDAGGDGFHFVACFGMNSTVSLPQFGQVAD